MREPNQACFEELRRGYPVFTFHRFHYHINQGMISIRFEFSLSPEIRFSPSMTLHLGSYFNPASSPEEIEGIVFHIGLIELISYWKAASPPTIHISRYRLTPEQQEWWKKLYWKGLGEFFYQNSITTSFDDFVNFTFDDDALPSIALPYRVIDESERVIVPIGGGKDSVVTLEELRPTRAIVPFIINPREATLACARVAGFEHREEIVILEREIDPVLLQLNKQGFLNGHTPFSAMLAFHSLLVSYATGTRDIALSNESSANEPTIPGTEINHQYSKSEEFEKDFRQYVHNYMSGIAFYFSYLRPYSELEIAEKFARYPAYFPIFRSCNVGSKENRWCCSCPKCLFTAIILSPFLEEDQLLTIFGEDLLDKPSMVSYFDELTGIAEAKPFECVGTLEEVNQALRKVAGKFSHKYLIQHYLKKNQ